MLDPRPLTELTRDEKSAQVALILRKLQRALSYTIEQLRDDAGNFEWNMTHSFTFGLPGVVPIKIEIAPLRDVKLRTIKLLVMVTQVPRNGSEIEPGHPDISPMAPYRYALAEAFEHFDPLEISTGDDPCPYLVIGPPPAQP